MFARTLLLITLSSVLSAQPQSNQARGASYSVGYTGRMLGYFRAPDEQQLVSGAAGGCPAPTGPALAFQKLIESFQSQILVSMGDNFAPQLLARTMVVTSGADLYHLGKDLYTWDYLSSPNQWVRNDSVSPNLNNELNEGISKIAIDNVVCFLQSAGFDALVPGKNDFYFGPERLRELARLLAEKKIQMLAANLTVASTVPDAAPRVPDAQKHLESRHGYTNQSKEISVGIPAVVLPSLRQFPVSGALELKQSGKPVSAGDLPPHQLLSAKTAVIVPVTGTLSTGGKSYDFASRITSAFLCKAARYAGTYSDPDDLKLVIPGMGKPQLCTSFGNPTASVRAIELDPLPLEELSADATFTFRNSSDRLEPDQTYHFCAVLALGTSHYYCSSFSVHAPFFQYRHSASSAAPATPGDYKIKDLGSPDKPFRIAIFGVVDPALTAEIGTLNDSWVNATKPGTYATQIEASDPLSALQQVLQECSEDPECRGARKILLAQMERGKAGQLAARLKPTFDLIIAEPDPAVYSEEETVARSAEQPGDSPLPFLVMPRPHALDRPDTLDIRLSRATVKLPPDCTVAGCPGTRTLVNHVASVTALPPPPTLLTTRRPATTTPTASSMTLFDVLRKFVEQKTPGFAAPTPDAEKSALVAQAALLAMRAKYGTDLALIQSRDVWDAANKSNEIANPVNIQRLLDVIFWKGDFVFREPVSGATLKSIMAQSDKWAAQDKNALNTDLETKRDLISTGIFKDAGSDSFIVNGIPVDDGKLYGVTMTDYLAFGDTGYPDLQKAAVPPPDRLSDKMMLVSLSGLLCEGIQNTVPGFQSAACHNRAVSGAAYLDHLLNRPFDTTPGITPARHVVDWLIFRRTRNIFEPLKTTADQAVQQRRLFTFTLDKAEFGYTVNDHNGTEADVARKFTGVPVAPVTAADSITLTSDYSFRASMSTRHYEFFSQNDMQYSQLMQRGTDNAYVRSQKANSLATELGAATRIYPRRRQVSNLKVLSSLRMETQTARPLVSFSLSDGSTVRGATDRSQRFYSKVGLRFDDAKSWIEGGFEPGRNFNTPMGYIFNPGTATEKTCYAVAGKAVTAPGAATTEPAVPDATTSLTDCVSYWSRTKDAAGNPVTQIITSTSSFRPLTRDRWESGFFLNFKANVPLPFNSFGKPTFYVMQNKGDWFFSRRDDVSLDTKYFVDWSHSLVVPLFGNFSIVPKVEVFFYKNKVEGNTFHAVQTSVNFQYAFDWHQGLSLWKTMKYPNASGLAASK